MPLHPNTLTKSQLVLLLSRMSIVFFCPFSSFLLEKRLAERLILQALLICLLLLEVSLQLVHCHRHYNLYSVMKVSDEIVMNTRVEILT